MKLIDADALKEEVKTMFCPDGYKIMMLKQIDNAPSVNPCKNCDLYFKAMTKEEMKKGGVE
jgi:hypothetical protein